MPAIALELSPDCGTEVTASVAVGAAAADVVVAVLLEKTVGETRVLDGFVLMVGKLELDFKLELDRVVEDKVDGRLDVEMLGVGTIKAVGTLSEFVTGIETTALGSLETAGAEAAGGSDVNSGTTGASDVCAILTTDSEAIGAAEVVDCRCEVSATVDVELSIVADDMLTVPVELPDRLDSIVEVGFGMTVTVIRVA